MSNARYGHITFRSGREVLSPDGNGGVFVEVVTFSQGGGRRTFTDLDTMNIFGQVIYGGYHTIRFARDGNGYPYVEADPFTPPASAPTTDWTTKIAVFAL
jgi:hypothetical protein